MTRGEGKKGQKMERGEVKFRRQGSKVATLWCDKRPVAVLSTNVDPVMGKALRHTGKGRREEVPISQPILAYNQHMGGVDLHDQHRAYYPVGRPCRKWWRYLFWFFVQSSLINSFIIFCKTNSPRVRSKRLQDPLYFRLAVFEGLVHGSVITKRQATTMQPSLMGRRAISDPTRHPLVRLPGRKKSCVQCLKMGRRQPSGRSKETVMGCTACKVHLCKGHCFAQFHAELL
ncbi:hypothetical protein ACOMHN_038814 [Nucella lapillus]